MFMTKMLTGVASVDELFKRKKIQNEKALYAVDRFFRKSPDSSMKKVIESTPDLTSLLKGHVDPALQ